MKKYVVIVRGKLKIKDEQAAQKAHDEFVALATPMTKAAGALSHHAHLNPQNRNEFMAIDVWNNMESPMKLFSDPKLAAGFNALFDGQPDISMWESTEWYSF